ncbi:MAG: hypothetical protein R3E89_00020 [Thiolinea sp.]
MTYSCAGCCRTATAYRCRLPLAPHQVEWRSEDSGWTLAGVRDNGSPEAQLQLNRVLDAAEQQTLEQEQSILPVFVRIERRLQLGTGLAGGNHRDPAGAAGYAAEPEPAVAGR